MDEAKECGFSLIQEILQSSIEIVDNGYIVKGTAIKKYWNGTFNTGAKISMTKKHIFYRSAKKAYLTKKLSLIFKGFISELGFIILPRNDVLLKWPLFWGIRLSMIDDF